MNKALRNDIDKNYLEAVYFYEIELKKDCPEIHYFTNLAFLYWAFASEQFEFNILNNISDEMSVEGGKKYSKIINMGLTKYPNSVELNFWKRYFPYRLFMDEFSENDCEKMIAEYGDKESLIPYFFLYLFNKEKYISQVEKLLEVCTENPTAKHNYIRSVIGNTNGK